MTVSLRESSCGGSNERAIRGDEPTWTISCERVISIDMAAGRRSARKIPAAAFWKPFYAEMNRRDGSRDRVEMRRLYNKRPPTSLMERP